MIGPTFVALVLLLYAHSHCQAVGTCTSKETRRAFVNEFLATMNCDNYTCGI